MVDDYEIYMEAEKYMYKDSKELQALEAFGKMYRLKNIKKGIIYLEAIKIYYKIIDGTIDLFQALKINDPLSYQFAFSYMLNNGYFSQDKEFFYIEEHDFINISICFGLDIVLGVGCCRHSTDMLNKIQKYADYEAYFTALSNNIIVPRSVGNHAVSLVNYNNAYYGCDTINNNIYRFDEDLVTHDYDDSIYHDTSRYRMKPGSIFMHNEILGSKVVDIIDNIKNASPSVYLSYADLKEMEMNTFDTCAKNRNMLLDFYNQNLQNIDNINKILVR